MVSIELFGMNEMSMITIDPEKKFVGTGPTYESDATLLLETLKRTLPSDTRRYLFSLLLMEAENRQVESEVSAIMNDGKMAVIVYHPDGTREVTDADTFKSVLDKNAVGTYFTDSLDDGDNEDDEGGEA